MREQRSIRRIKDDSERAARETAWQSAFDALSEELDQRVAERTKLYLEAAKLSRRELTRERDRQRQPVSDLTLNTIARRMAIRKGDNCRYFSRHVCSFRDPRRLQREVGPWSNVILREGSANYLHGIRPLRGNNEKP